MEIPDASGEPPATVELRHPASLGAGDAHARAQARVCPGRPKPFGGGVRRASFHHQLVDPDDPRDYDVHYCSTDQVRFARSDGATWQPAPVADVPPLVFTEAMRDVDLFVGVTSIATDPQWADRGEDRFRDYWHRTAVGALTPSAQVSRDALARLLPAWPSPTGHPRGPTPARTREPARLPDPPRLGQHHDGAPRRLPVHRPRMRGHRMRHLP